METLRSVYLIDTENVVSEWVGEIKLCTPNDKIILFVGPTRIGVPYPKIETFIKMYPPCQIEILYTPSGHNSMDFHICAKLGTMIGKTPNSRYYIISKDTGYDPLTTTYCNNGHYVRRISPNELQKEYKTLNDSKTQKAKKGTASKKQAEPIREATALLPAESSNKAEALQQSQPIKIVKIEKKQDSLPKSKKKKPVIKESKTKRFNQAVMGFLKNNNIDDNAARSITNAIAKAKKPYTKTIAKEANEIIMRTVGKGSKENTKLATELMKKVKNELGPYLDKNF